MQGNIDRFAFVLLLSSHLLLLLFTLGYYNPQNFSKNYYYCPNAIRTGMTYCPVCSPGYGMDNRGECVLCPPGTYATGYDICELVPVGKNVEQPYC